MKYLMIILSFFAFFGLTACDPMGDGKSVVVTDQGGNDGGGGGGGC